MIGSACASNAEAAPAMAWVCAPKLPLVMVPPEGVRGPRVAVASRWARGTRRPSGRCRVRRSDGTRPRPAHGTRAPGNVNLGNETAPSPLLTCNRLGAKVPERFPDEVRMPGRHALFVVAARGPADVLSRS